MIENNPTNVSSAFEMLLEEVEAEIDFVNGVGSKSFEGRDYQKAKEALERSGVLTAFRDRVAAIRKEWEELAAAAERDEDEETRAQRRNLGKLRKGQRTPEAAYYLPLLRILDQMGGSGKVAEVLERVGKLMKPILKPVDYDPLASGPDNPRWRNAAQWARNSMIRESLLKADSPRGVWEISDKGRQALKDSAKQGSK
jgi:restriction system protein